MNDIIVARLENDTRHVDRKNFVVLINNTSQSLSVSSKQPAAIAVRRTTIKTKTNK